MLSDLERVAKEVSQNQRTISSMARGGIAKVNTAARIGGAYLGNLGHIGKHPLPWKATSRGTLGAMAGPVGRAATWLAVKGSNHPAAMVGGFAAAGLYRAHPLRKIAGIGAVTGIPGLMLPLATGSAVSEALLGDPDARSKMTQAVFSKAAANYISPSGNADMPSYNGTGSSLYGPNGSLIFGLYNDRLK